MGCRGFRTLYRGHAGPRQGWAPWSCVLEASFSRAGVSRPCPRQGDTALDSGAPSLVELLRERERKYTAGDTTKATVAVDREVAWPEVGRVLT